MDLIVLAICFAGLGLTLSIFKLGSFKNASSSSNLLFETKHERKQRRLLVITAHPDDECMFFGPAILHFSQKEGALVYLLCLSPGGFYKEEKRRANELWASCKLLGIRSENIILYNCEDLPDNPSVMWPLHHTSQIISHNIHCLDIDMVLTFDSQGISGHVNHCAIYNALMHLIEDEDQELPSNCEFYVLESVNFLRKYSSIFDVYFSYIFAPCAFIVNFHQFTAIQKAMRAHESQFVWFRKLYIIFSRYVLINTLKKIK